MLKEIIEHINSKIETLDRFDVLHGMCEQIAEIKDEVELSYPAEYQKKGELKKVDLEVNRSVLWWRRNGEVSISQDDDFLVGCRTGIVQVFPVSLVGCVIRCGDDDAYKSDRIVGDIIHTIQEDDNRDLVATITADSLIIQPVSYSVLREEILNEEFTNQRVKLPYDATIFRIDLSITVESDKGCYDLSPCGCNGDEVFIVDEDGNYILDEHGNYITE